MVKVRVRVRNDSTALANVVITWGVYQWRRFLDPGFSVYLEGTDNHPPDDLPELVLASSVRVTVVDATYGGLRPTSYRDNYGSHSLNV